MVTSDKYKDGVFYGTQDLKIPLHMNFGKFFLDAIKQFKNKIALINGLTNESITYKELVQKVVNTASSLINLGIKTGDVVAICSENRIEYIITTLAVFCSGGIVTFFNSSYNISEMKHALHISKPKFMFLSTHAYEKYYEGLQAENVIQKFIIFDEQPVMPQHLHFKQLADNYVDVDSFKPVHFEGEVHTCMILYSSGTTGLAKGAKLSHLNFIVVSQRPTLLTRDLLMLQVAPWSSTLGIAKALDDTIRGKTTVYLPRYQERQYLQTIEKYKIGVIIIAPPLLVMLCKSKIADEYNLSSLEIIISGGAPIDLDTIHQAKKRYPHLKRVLQGYGMTEVTGALTEDSEVTPKEGSVGPLAEGCIVKVVDPSTGKILGCREPGEIQVKGPVLFQGYIGISTESNFTPDGFYKTGDIAYYDEDGYFYIIDRIKELIKYNAWQVAPSELEALLLEHPGVMDVGVTGKPDLSAGELPTAFVVKQPNSRVTEKELIEHVDSKVSPWKKLRGGVIFVNEIPKTASGKILRRKLKEIIANVEKDKARSKL
ncbi:unnamed protein product [Colias eurytheme]|nr:unnamed protein product [Colias eurytheme]